MAQGLMFVSLHATLFPGDALPLGRTSPQGAEPDWGGDSIHSQVLL